MINIDVKEYLNSRKFSVLFSGGKDSLATLLWVLDNVQHERWNILYIEITGNTHKLCNQYVHEICDELGVSNKLIHAKRQDLDFFDALKKWGIPILGKSRWCLSQFKRKVMIRHSHLIQVLGIKATDSCRRKGRPLVELYRITNHIVVKPIYYWTKKQVIDYIRSWNLDINPCYAIYRHSGNCMFCPYHNKAQIILTLADSYWRKKILDALKAQRSPKVFKIKGYYYWLRFLGQTTLV